MRISKAGRRSLLASLLVSLLATAVGSASPARADTTIAAEDAAGFRSLWAQGGPFTPGLSAGPEVGWNAGLTELRPLGASYYRLWDMKVAWRDVNPADGVFDWSILDQRVTQVESWGGKPILVLGLTPQWAASDPNAGDPRWGAGTASPPANMDTWRAYVRALVQRYGSRIGAYEIWNEANLQTFWSGSAQQMADMVRIATEEIGTSSLALAPSVTTRLKSGADFTAKLAAAMTPATIAQLDAWSIHTYPAGDAGPSVSNACEQRVEDIVRWQQALVRLAQAIPSVIKPMWDTEINYGLAGPGARPRTVWSDADGASLLICTYQDSRALGIAVTVWYEFTAAEYDLLGVQMNPATPQINAAWTQLAETSKQTNTWIPSVAGGQASGAQGSGSSAKPAFESVVGSRGPSELGLPSGETCRSSVEGPLRPPLSSSCVVAVGKVTGISQGSAVIPEYRFPGQGSYTQGIEVLVGPNGQFTWYRKTGKKIYVRFTYQGILSERIIIPAK